MKFKLSFKIENAVARNKTITKQICLLLKSFRMVIHQNTNSSISFFTIVDSLSVEEIPAELGSFSSPRRRAERLLRSDGHHLSSRGQAIPGKTRTLVI
jgi:hypothetical protein